MVSAKKRNNCKIIAGITSSSGFAGIKVSIIVKKVKSIATSNGESYYRRAIIAIAYNSNNYYSFNNYRRFNNS